MADYNGYIATITFSLNSQVKIAQLLFSGSQEKQTVGQIEATSGVIPVCSIASVCQIIFFNISTSQLNYGQTSENSTLNGSINMLA